MSRLRGASASRWASGVAVFVLVVVAVAVALVRAMPSMVSPDHGIFVSVSERLNAGDRLYTEVWDNKDPLFYFLTAVGRLVTPLADYALELAWLLAVALAVAAVARRLAVGTAPPVVAAAVAVLAITGTSYLAGYPHLPGAALTVVALALAVHERHILAGVVLGMAAMTMVMALPLGVVALLVWDLRQGRSHAMVRQLSGAAGAIAVFAGLLAIRGELGAYAAKHAGNVTYVESRLGDGALPLPVRHLAEALVWRDWLVICGVFALVSLVAALRLVRPDSVGREAASFAWATAGVTVVSLAMLAAIGLSSVYAQILQVSVAMAACLAAVPVGVCAARGATATLLVLGIPLTAWLLAGMPGPQMYMQDARELRFKAELLVVVPPDTQAILALGRTGSYARLGTVYDTGHAKGLGAWALKCPRFHQNTFQPKSVLDGVLSCTATSPVVLVSSSFTDPSDPRNVAWTAFRRDAEALLARAYSCTSYTGFRLCTRPS